MVDREKYKARFRERYAEQRKMMHAYLNQYSCVICGSSGELQFDHIDPKLKTFPVGLLFPKNRIPELLVELDKCQVLCFECHVKKTAIEFSLKPKTFKHGTVYSTTKVKCQCLDCALTLMDYYKKRNARRRMSGSSARGQYREPAECGTYKKYKRGCKCVLCKKANTDQARQYKKLGDVAKLG